MAMEKGYKKRKINIWVKGDICYIELQDKTTAKCDADQFDKVKNIFWRWFESRNSVVGKGGNKFLSAILYPDKKIWFINNDHRDLRKSNISYSKRPPFICEKGLCHIPLDHNQESICDKEYFDFVKDLTWYTDGRGYVFSFPKNKKIMLHKYILPNCEYVDHIDNNRLNNCKSNLRSCTNQQNAFNSGRHCNKNPKIKYKGVYISGKKSFYASISVGGKYYYLGSFKTQEAAAKAYSDKAKELHGEFANKGDFDE